MSGDRNTTKPAEYSLNEIPPWLRVLSRYNQHVIDSTGLSRAEIGANLQYVIDNTFLTLPGDPPLGTIDENGNLTDLSIHDRLNLNEVEAQYYLGMFLDVIIFMDYRLPHNILLAFIFWNIYSHAINSVDVISHTFEREEHLGGLILKLLNGEPIDRREVYYGMQDFHRRVMKGDGTLPADSILYGISQETSDKRFQHAYQFCEHMKFYAARPQELGGWPSRRG